MLEGHFGAPPKKVHTDTGQSSLLGLNAAEAQHETACEATAPAGKYTLQNKPGGPRSGLFNDDRIRSIQPLLGLMRDIGSAHDKSPAQVAVNWVISKGEQEGLTAIPILGMSPTSST